MNYRVPPSCKLAERLRSCSSSYMVLALDYYGEARLSGTRVKGGDAGL
jgi:hypothetical protein